MDFQDSLKNIKEKMAKIDEKEQERKEKEKIKERERRLQEEFLEYLK